MYTVKAFNCVQLRINKMSTFLMHKLQKNIAAARSLFYLIDFCRLGVRYIILYTCIRICAENKIKRFYYTHLGTYIYLSLFCVTQQCHRFLIVTLFFFFLCILL